MPKLLRTILIAIATLTTVIVVAVLVLFFVIDPNQYRSLLEETVSDATGLQLDIAGDLSLSIQPYVGITLTDVRLRNPARPQELASSNLISLRVDSMELLGGRLLVEELRADDLHINWYVDEAGNNSWETSRRRRPLDPGIGEAADEPAPLAANFNFISVNNASIDIQNLQRGYFYSVRNLDLDSQNSNLDNLPFALQASFDLDDHRTSSPLPFTFSSRNRIDLESGEVEITDIRLALTPALIEGSLRFRDLHGKPTWQGSFNAASFALDEMLENLRMERGQPMPPRLPGIGADYAWQMQIQAQVEGDEEKVRLTGLTASLGDAQLEMDAELLFATDRLPGNLRFDIETGDLDLTPYLPEDEDPLVALPEENDVADLQPPPMTVLDLEIPDYLLSDFNVQGTAVLNSLFVRGIQFGTVNLFANVESGVLDLELQPTPVLDGTVAGTLRINSIPADSQMTLRLDTSEVNIASLTLPVIVPGTLSGRLNLESRYSGRGSTLGEWLDSFSGASSFSVTDNSVDIGVIKQVFTAIAALSPTGEAIQQWPDVISFTEFTGFAVFEDGLDDNQQLKIRLDNFDISGTGGLDLDARDFDYQLLFTVLGDPFAQTIPINRRYHNVSWPVQCAARFDDPVNRYCRPDLAQVRDLFTRVANDEVEDRLDEVVPDQVPEPLQDSSRGLLRNLFRNQE